MPNLGAEHDVEFRLQQWHKPPGSKVHAGERLCAVYTNQSTLYVCAQHSGYVSQYYVKQDDSLRADDLLFSMWAVGEAPDV
jgi:pyruvate/2-oxoglutarate dehydrogenase complex dihydrolipoamide acyltransferase (E2) component